MKTRTDVYYNELY